MIEEKYEYPTYAKLIHLGLAFFGITAYLTSELTDKDVTSVGYLLHSYLGLSVATMIALRILIGSATSGALSFRGWSFFSIEQWKFALEDFRTILSLNIPEREKHQGLAGITQAFGLFIFTWMSLTGMVLFGLGSEVEGALFELIEEIHEVGETLVPLYLFLHVGAVVLHVLCGKPIWKKMFKFGSR
ncbi:MAG: cytochrome b/b6 domain-containing protein [Colwellia polaris]|jgi:cytochrome b561